jgi:ribonuclease-3
LGAIYLDSGIENVKGFFLKHFTEQLMQLIKDPAHNWKALLQDYFQKRLQKQPLYKVVSEQGPDHEKTFCVGVYLEEEELGLGQGLSKKEAEQNAAQVAYEKLKSRR